MNFKNITRAAVSAAAGVVFALTAHSEPAVVSPPPAGAPATPASSNALYRQFDELRSQNAILAETLRNAKLKSEILAIGSNVPAQQNATLGGVPGPTASPIQVEMVSGSGTQLVALIMLPTGGRVNARVGTNVPGLGVVKSITRNEVLVSNKAETLSLPFARDNSGGPTGTGASPMMFGGAR